MKKIYWIFILLLIVCTACKKSSVENNTSTGWTEEDQAFLENIQSLQAEAGDNYKTWSQSMDSLLVINKLQQFFLSDPSVLSATIGSQGIAVQYSNGMRGGLFLNPKRGATKSKMTMDHLPTEPAINTGIKSIVNNKKMVFFAPCYYQFEEHCNITLEGYKKNLPKVGFTFDAVYKDSEATLDRLTQLDGFGIIHLDSHGWAWPNDTEIKEVYFQTWDVLDEEKAKKYADDLKNGTICIPRTFKPSPENEFMQDICLITEKFIISHNDFSKDTVLFFGSFCYSFLGNWDQLPSKCAKGSYLGVDWSVRSGGTAIWAVSLMDSLCDITAKTPFTVGKWILGPVPPKYYFEPDEQRNVSIYYSGDRDLGLWKSLEIETTPITNITQTTATGGGNVKSDGGFPITARGVCLSLSPNPTIADEHTADGNGTGAFVSNLGGLTPNKQYYVRAYATNSQGTMYGNPVTFTTQKGTGETVADIDGNVYHKVTIGTQVWLVENLKVTRYSNGDPVPNVTKNSDWSEIKTGAWCDYENEGSNGITYGHLYNWRTAADPRNICPSGWHVPTDAEWTVLDDYLLFHVGGKMKETGTAHWASPNTGATNESGFTALPGGVRSWGGLFSEIGKMAVFWSSTADSDPNNAYYRQLLYDDDFMYRNIPTFIEDGSSIRCLKD